ncbi:hypothetical protein, partial [Corynebacterium jeddahense]|uniref:hypothetical protein n=1 Tax=Corynebacterium jeddahense TaxID=1414719 RepID=UPI001E3608B1
GRQKALRLPRSASGEPAGVRIFTNLVHNIARGSPPKRPTKAPGRATFNRVIETAAFANPAPTGSFAVQPGTHLAHRHQHLLRGVGHLLLLR